MSDLVADNLRDLRKRQNLTAANLAERCAERGVSWVTADTIRNVEAGRRRPNGERRRHITVDELVVFALALDVSPIHLLMPPEGADLPIADTGTVSERDARLWLRGDEAFTDQDEAVFNGERFRQFQRDKALGIRTQSGTPEVVAEVVRRVLSDPDVVARALADDEGDGDHAG